MTAGRSLMAVTALMVALPVGAQTTIWAEDQNGQTLGELVAPSTHTISVDSDGFSGVWLERGEHSGYVWLFRGYFHSTSIFFSEPGCQGTAYGFAFPSTPSYLEGPFFVVGGSPGDLWASHIPPSYNPLATTSVESFTNGGGTCSAHSATMERLVPLTELVESGFGDQFAEPFRIAAQPQVLQAAAVDAVSPMGLVVLAAAMGLVGVAAITGRRLFG